MTWPDFCFETPPERAFSRHLNRDVYEIIDINVQYFFPSQIQCFDGYIRRYKHDSEVLGCTMHFTVFFPPQAAQSHNGVPIIYYLSGLTCTDENFIQKAGAQSKASQLGVALIAPDTSPRGLGVPGEDDSYDFGTGAGFYLNASQEPWLKWRMYDYITAELPSVLRTLKGLNIDKVGWLNDFKHTFHKMK